MNKAAAAALSVAILGGCGSAPPTADTSAPIRSASPVNHQSAITSFFALTMAPKPNRLLVIGKPEPGACPTGGPSGAHLGWVVPVVDSTRQEATAGRPADVNVTGTRHYFWFSNEVIYGVTRRMELCP